MSFSCFIDADAIQARQTSERFILTAKQPLNTTISVQRQPLRVTSSILCKRQREPLGGYSDWTEPMTKNCTKSMASLVSEWHNMYKSELRLRRRNSVDVQFTLILDIPAMRRELVMRIPRLRSLSWQRIGSGWQDLNSSRGLEHHFGTSK